MTDVSNFTMTAQSHSLPNKSEDKPYLSDTLVRHFFGLVFGFAAIGLWLAPSASETADVLLLKTGFTAILCFCCIAALLPRL
jgi:hypothetical protein